MWTQRWGLKWLISDFPGSCIEPPELFWKRGFNGVQLCWGWGWCSVCHGARKDRQKGRKSIHGEITEVEWWTSKVSASETQSPLFLWKKQARPYMQGRGGQPKADLAHNFILFRMQRLISLLVIKVSIRQNPVVLSWALIGGVCSLGLFEYSLCFAEEISTTPRTLTFSRQNLGSGIILMKIITHKWLDRETVQKGMYVYGCIEKSLK